MTQRLETAFKRASCLPEAIQDAIADEVLARVEAEEEAQKHDSDTPFVSAYDVSKHLAGIAKGGRRICLPTRSIWKALGSAPYGEIDGFGRYRPDCRLLARERA